MLISTGIFQRITTMFFLRCSCLMTAYHLPKNFRVKFWFSTPTGPDVIAIRILFWPCIMSMSCPKPNPIFFFFIINQTQDSKIKMMGFFNHKVANKEFVLLLLYYNLYHMLTSIHIHNFGVINSFRYQV